MITNKHNNIIQLRFVGTQLYRFGGACERAAMSLTYYNNYNNKII